MSPLDWAMAVAAVALIAFVNWFFLGSKGTPVVAIAQPGGDVRLLLHRARPVRGARSGDRGESGESESGERRTQAAQGATDPVGGVHFFSSTIVRSVAHPLDRPPGQA